MEINEAGIPPIKVEFREREDGGTNAFVHAVINGKYKEAVFSVSKEDRLMSNWQDMIKAEIIRSVETFIQEDKPKE